MDEEKIKRRRKGQKIAGAIAVYGVLSAIWGYYRDRDSVDFITMSNAWDYVILHLVLYGLAALLVLGWYFRDPTDDRSF